MKEAVRAIIQKDVRSVTANSRLLAPLLIVPIVMTVVLPTIFFLIFHFAPEDPELEELVQMLPPAARAGSLEETMLGMILNYILPAFFLMIPIMAASVMAAASFVGEKEKRTLETLLYAPLSLREIFRAKVLAAFLLSMLVTFASFAAMLLVLETEAVLMTGKPLLPGAGWLAVLLLVAPSVSLIAVTLIVRASARAKSMEESQQGAVFLIMPLILLVAGQFSGVMLLSVWLLLGIGVLCAALAWLLLRRALGRFTYEMLLK